ncbi:terminase large subunit domain-containing protein, partial [Bacteroides fragilis]
MGGRRRKTVLRRLVRRAILFVPRKFSKTTSSSSLAVSELLFGDANAQAYTAANGYKQAQVCFKEISKIVKQLDPKRRTFKKTREHIEWRENKFGKESFVECL